jgi:predicted  nucleic acid-binding Zn-ribbon protein
MTEQLELASRLQAYDQHIAQLQKEIAALPKHIAQIEKALDAHLRRLEADRAALAANQRERKRLEDDVKVNEQKISKLKDQMLQAKTNEQYRAFQHEIEFCEKEIRKAEDKILDLMSESEPLDQNVKKAEAALAQEKKAVEAEKAQARERTAKDEAELKRLREEREQALGALTPEVRSAYERIRKKWNGTVLAEATDGRCGACYISLRPQLFQELRKGDKLVFCESCGRFLFYNPPVAVDLSGNTQAAPRD